MYEMSSVTADSIYSVLALKIAQFPLGEKKISRYPTCPKWNPELSGLSIITPLLIFHKA